MCRIPVEQGSHFRRRRRLDALAHPTASRRGQGIALYSRDFILVWRRSPSETTRQV